MDNLVGQKLLDEIERELEEAAFTEVKFVILSEQPDSTSCNVKTTSGWSLLAVEFPIEGKGFKPGSKDYDGAGTKKEDVLHLPRYLAKRVFDKAREHEAEGSV